MTDSDKCCPPPKDVQDFRFKEESTTQICDEYQKVPVASSLIAADGKRGLLYICHESKLIVFYPGTNVHSHWKLDLDLPYKKACRVELNCDSSLLAIVFDQPIAVIYSANSIGKHRLEKIHEIRLSSTAGEVLVSDFKWNPAIPFADTFCSVTSDYIIGSFQVSKEKGVHIIGREKPSNFEALCVSWSPKGKQLVVGCKNGDIVQLKPDLKIARHLTAPSQNEGMIISILWISNYQFCACFFQTNEQRISVMIVDAPKGVTTPKLVNYEDVTYGTGPTDQLCYYFEHIPEWGIIIAASSHSSELAVLGTSDNGANWNLWQLMEGSTVQLPLDRKKETENYPVGLAVDKSSMQILPWGTDSTLPNPVPILRILVTSGQMCCYHMVNLKENAPVICAPPTEIVSAPVLPRPSLGPSEVSFNLPSGATSTPQKQTLPAMQFDKTKAPAEMFANLAGTNFSFPAIGSKTTREIGGTENEVKMSGLFGQGDGKSNLFQPTSATFNKTLVNQAAQPIQQIKSFAPNIQPQAPPKIDPKPAMPIATPQPEFKEPKEPVKELPQPRTVETRSPNKQTTVYDEGLCLQAFHEEQARFEKELRVKLEQPSWNCGSEEERGFIVKKTDEMNEFFKELQETTNSLASDVAYLKALLLQSFAWLEETKSKSSVSVGGVNGNRSRPTEASSKLAELQRLYDYTQTQLGQASKVLDLEWAEYNNREMTRMKIPSMEIIYQSLIKHTQIISQQKKSVEELTKKWRSIARGSHNLSGVTDGTGASPASADLHRSMASLNISSQSLQGSNNTTLDCSAAATSSAIELRCKLIASNTRNFTKEKQMKLRDLLMVTEPKIVPAMKPTAVQERLQATLSSLASLKATEASIKSSKPNKFTVAQASVNLMGTVKQLHTETMKLIGSDEHHKVAAAPAKPTSKQMINPLSSLDNLVSGLGGQQQQPSSMAAGIGQSQPAGLIGSKSPLTPFSTMSVKPPNVPSLSPQNKSKENVSFMAGDVAQQSTTAGTNKAFSFSNVGLQASANSPKPGQLGEGVPKFTGFTGASTFGKPMGGDATSQGLAATPVSGDTAASPTAAVKLNFSAGSAASNQAFAGMTKPADNGSSVFKFSTKSIPALSPPTSSPSLNFAAIPSTGISSPSTFSFGKATTPASPMQQPQQQQQLQSPLFGQSTSPGKNTQFSFGKTTPSMAAPNLTATGGDKSIPTTSAQASVNFATSLSMTSPSSTTTTTTSSSILGAGGDLATSFSTLSSGLGTAASTAQQAAPTSTALASRTEPKLTPAVPASDTSTTAPSSVASIASLLGTTASLSFGGPSTTSAANPSLSSFGSVFAAAYTQPSKPESQSPTSSAPLGVSTGASIFSAGNNVSSTSANSSIFGGQTAASTAGGNSFFSNKAASATTAASGTSIFSGISSTSSSIFGGSVTSAPAAFASSSTTQPSNVFGTSITPVTATATTQATGTTVFGSPTTVASQSSVFGSSSGNSGTTPSNAGSIFGAAGLSQPNKSIFGSSPAAQSRPVGFNAATTAGTAGAPVFGAVTTGGLAATTSTTSTLFGTGNVSAAPSAAVSPFGASSTSVFSGSSNATAPSSVFGLSSPAATSASSIFGAPATPAAAATTAGSSIFGQSTGTTTAQSLPSMFGASPTPTTATGASVFGGPPSQPAAGIFGAASPAGGNSASSVFGASPSLGANTSMFGASSTSMFGQSAAFGSKSVFGATPTGFGSPAAATAPAAGFGSPPAFGGTPGFGSPPTFGGVSSAASASPSKVFGSNTFESLGAQPGGLSFGSLAQGKVQQQEQKPVFQGSSSFSSWR